MVAEVGVRSGFGEISQLTLKLFFQMTGRGQNGGPPHYYG